MINYKEIEQRSEQWFEIKHGKIGGTLSKGLHTKGDTLFIDILSQHIEDYEPEESYQNEAMLRGNELEPFALDFLKEYTNIDFLTAGWLQSEENELLGISPDGITEDETLACEIKCFGRKKHTEVLLSNEIPLENIHQCIHYFTVNPKLVKLYWIAFRPESLKNNFIKELTLDSEVNIGTNARPVLKTIKECRELSLNEANELLTRINKQVEQLKF